MRLKVSFRRVDRKMVDCKLNGRVVAKLQPKSGSTLPGEPWFWYTFGGPMIRNTASAPAPDLDAAKAEVRAHILTHHTLYELARSTP